MTPMTSVRSTPLTPLMTVPRPGAAAPASAPGERRAVPEAPARASSAAAPRVQRTGAPVSLPYRRDRVPQADAA